MMNSEQNGQRNDLLGFRNGRSAEPPRSDDRSMELEMPQSTQPLDGIEPLPAGEEEIHNELTAPLLQNGLTAPLPQNGLTAPLLPTLDEMEIETRMWIKKEKKEKFKEALEMWEAKDKLFADRMDKKKKQSNSLRNEIYQLVGFYLVFQGVLLTAVALANLLTCHTWWSVFFLSLLACIVTIGGVIQKFYSVIALETTIASEGFSRQVCINRARALLRKGKKFSFKEDTKDPSTDRSPSSQFWLKCWTCVVVAILFIFSCLFLASVRLILCNSGK